MMNLRTSMSELTLCSLILSHKHLHRKPTRLSSKRPNLKRYWMAMISPSFWGKLSKPINLGSYLSSQKRVLVRVINRIKSLRRKSKNFGKRRTLGKSLRKTRS